MFKSFGLDKLTAAFIVFTIAIISNSVSRRLIAEPTPTADAPIAKAIRTVNSDSPEAQIKGVLHPTSENPWKILYIAPKVGEALSIRPKIPDFAGEMLDKYTNLRLVDYGFFYHKDESSNLDDITWFLIEKADI